MKSQMLVAGGYGFVGSAFIKEAAKSFDISIVTRRRRRAADIVWDLTGETIPEGVGRYDVVIHLASLTAKDKADAYAAEEYRKHNVIATEHLLKSLEMKSPAYLMYVSTIDVYGTPSGVINEETTTHPETRYAISKSEAEVVCRQWCEAHNVTCCIARLGSIYGPGERKYKKVVPMFIRTALAQRPLPVLGDGGARRQFLYVDDAARALIRLVTCRAEGIYNAAGVEPVSVINLAKLINELTGNPAGITRIETQASYDVLVDTRKLAVLGVVPSIALEEGLKKEIAWLRGSAAL
jgi:UDP-glucose 4-epimerase